MSKTEVTGTLENWTYTIGPRGGYLFSGYLYNDSKNRWEDGTPIMTSLVRDVSVDYTEGSIVQTRNSTYLLGKRMGDSVVP